jgi:hypothetical protein
LAREKEMPEKEISLEARYNAVIAMAQTYHDALEQIMRHAVHSATLDVNSARKALAEIYRIARECRNVEGE